MRQKSENKICYYEQLSPYSMGGRGMAYGQLNVCLKTEIGEFPLSKEILIFILIFFVEVHTVSKILFGTFFYRFFFLWLGLLSS